MAYGTPGVHTHQEWLGLVQPVGLVVAPVVLTRLGLFPETRTVTLADGQRCLLDLFEEVEDDQGVPVSAVPRFADLALELLEWSDGDLLAFEALPTPIEVQLEEYGEVLRPTHAVAPAEESGRVQVLIQELPISTDFDAVCKAERQGWEATYQQRFERLLKESEYPIGVLYNGIALRLVYAPRGESSGYLTFPLEPMATVAGRPMLAALQMLLGVDRLFGGSRDQRLPVLLAQSRREQNEVSTRLAEQVLEALWELLQGFDQAERSARERGRTVLADLATREPGHIYGGLITVLLRLVFLLYAEDEDLMPPGSLYGQHYSVSGLADRLRRDRIEYQGAMADRRGAWGSLLSLFRLVYDGGGPTAAYLPARHGELFDPDAYPFLEGRPQDSYYTAGVLDQLPAISDDVVEKVLTRLLWLDGERLSYRALDVEQIGSVYEGIMGFTVEQAQAPSLGITYRPPRQKITITVVVEADRLLAQSPAKREKWLDEHTGVSLKLPAAVKKDLRSATTLADLLQALGKRLSPHTPRGLEAGSLVLQPTAERRRSGSHYTPRALTEPIVQETFRPWLERCGGKPTAEQVLQLKVCDPAMGSGAFLVATCRYLAAHLVAAWTDQDGPGFPPEFRQPGAQDTSLWDKDIYARRLVAQRCLYGVDRNPFAVSLAKLSLWLVTLSRELPFTFVDHALKCGDSLVGCRTSQITEALGEVQLSLLDRTPHRYESLGQERQASFSDDSRDDAADTRKRQQLQRQIQATEVDRQAGDLIVAAFFAAAKPKQRAERQQEYLALLGAAPADPQRLAEVQAIRRHLAAGDRGIRPFHWDLEFPEVFQRDSGGFDVFVGNPPFVGGRKMKEALGECFQHWLQDLYPESSANGDLSAFFFRRCFSLLRPGGSLGLIATNTIAQGDTRSTGLRWICTHEGTIYSARKRVKWPGVAAVVVSVVHLLKGAYTGEKRLDGRPVERITAFLFANGGHEDPKPLLANAGKSFQGSIVLGMGFTFDDSGEADDETPGIPSPIATMQRLIAEHPKNAEVIFPYIGGEEVNSSPTHAHHRYVIDFRDRSEEECWREWPDLMDLLERKVKPERTRKKPDGEYTLRSPLPQRWWQHADKRPALYAAIAGCEQLLVIPRVSMRYGPALVRPGCIFSEQLIIFPVKDRAFLIVLLAQMHELWFTFRASTFGSADAPRYAPTDIFETFPLPASLPDSDAENLSYSDHRLALESIGHRYYQFRAELMEANNEGLTSTYNRFHDPGEASSGILELRRLHSEMDRAVLEAYGWSDLPTDCGFGLDYLDLEDDLELPADLQQRVDSGDLFFPDTASACDFQGQLLACTGSRRKLPWRYRWPDAVRDDVLARLLALNAERYAEEVAQGLHDGGRKATKARTPKAARGASGRSKADTTGETMQMGLGL